MLDGKGGWGPLPGEPIEPKPVEIVGEPEPLTPEDHRRISGEDIIVEGTSEITPKDEERFEQLRRVITARNKRVVEASKSIGEMIDKKNSSRI